jgi:hypothetical protein
MRLQAGVAADAAFPVLTAGYNLSAKERNMKNQENKQAFR